jgi:hypothetical protein
VVLTELSLSLFSFCFSEVLSKISASHFPHHALSFCQLSGEVAQRQVVFSICPGDLLKKNWGTSRSLLNREFWVPVGYFKKRQKLL